MIIIYFHIFNKEATTPTSTDNLGNETSTGNYGRKKRDISKEQSTEEPHSPSILEYAINPVYKKETESLSAQALDNTHSTFDQMNVTGYKSLFEILWYKQLPCFDVRNTTSDANHQHGMIKYCEWKGQKVPCSAIFQTSPTDRGMCCTFNLQAAEEMFKDEQYRVTFINVLLFYFLYFSNCYVCEHLRPDYLIFCII